MTLNGSCCGQTLSASIDPFHHIAWLRSYCQRMITVINHHQWPTVNITIVQRVPLVTQHCQPSLNMIKLSTTIAHYQQLPTIHPEPYQCHAWFLAKNHHLPLPGQDQYHESLSTKVIDQSLTAPRKITMIQPNKKITSHWKTAWSTNNHGHHYHDRH